MKQAGTGGWMVTDSSQDGRQGLLITEIGGGDRRAVHCCFLGGAGWQQLRSWKKRQWHS